jgi:hypothetical protein
MVLRFKPSNANVESVPIHRSQVCSGKRTQLELELPAQPMPACPHSWRIDK